MSWLVDALRHNPELAIFLTLALGFFIGRFKFGGFSLGTVVGTLLAGVLVGQIGVQVPAVVKTVFFDLFLFTTGYKVGPQFFRGLKKDALSQVLLTVVLCVTCLLTAFTASKLLGYDRARPPGSWPARSRSRRSSGPPARRSTAWRFRVTRKRS